MNRHTVINRVLLLALTLWLVNTLGIIGGCKKKDQPEDIPQAAEPEMIGTTEKFGLHILYVGLPDTERQKDFVEFLRKHFQQVETADYNTFKEEQTRDCDVAIFDKDGLEWKPLDIDVSSQYSRATVSIGVPGAFWCRKVSSKMGYM